MVLLVGFEMRLELLKTAAQNRNLDFGRTGIGLMNLIFCDDLPLYVCCQRHYR